MATELPSVERYGAPSYGALGLPPAGLVIHTPEWLDYPSLDYAIDCAQWQGTASNKSGGSYHGILGHDDDAPDDAAGCEEPDHWVMVRSVAWNLAAGGLSGDHGYWHWRPDRYPILAQLPANAYADPNRWLHQIALSGWAGYFVQNGYPTGMVTRLAEWIRLLELAYNYDSLLTLHRMWQTDRSDPGPVELIDLVLIEYTRLFLDPIPGGVVTGPPSPAELTREQRLAAEVIATRVAKPFAARHWANSTNLVQSTDGTPLKREDRLAGEILFLRASPVE